MQLNHSMQQLFHQHSLSSNDSFQSILHHPVWSKTDASGRPYWGTGSFCGLDHRGVSPDTNLSYLEWDGNEVRLSAETVGETAALLRQMLGILAFWQQEMTSKYPLTSFFIMASYDDGSGLLDDEDDQAIPSVTLRFWADRGDDTVAEVNDLDRYAQPVLLMHCP